MTNPPVTDYLQSMNRSPRTVHTYACALRQFERFAGARAALTPETYEAFLAGMKRARLSPTTQGVYRTAVLGYYAFCRAARRDELPEITKRYRKRAAWREIVIDADEIQHLITYCLALPGDLRGLRDRAYVLLLADSGLRTFEACSLRRGDYDRNNRRVLVMGKGDRQAFVMVSERARRALDGYLAARMKLDGATGKPLATLPLFATHGRRDKRRVHPITTGGMWRALKGRMREAGIDPATIRVHDLRHYAVSVFYAVTHDARATQEFARHRKADTTSRYTHLFNDEFERLYDRVFNRR